MSGLSHDEMLEVRRNLARSINKDRWTISYVSEPNREYARGKDKNGLSKEDRERIEAIKDRQTYGDDEQDLW